MGLIILYFLGALSLSFYAPSWRRCYFLLRCRLSRWRRIKATRLPRWWNNIRTTLIAQWVPFFRSTPSPTPSVLPAWVPSLSNSLAKNTSVSFPPFSPCWFWCFQKSSRRPSVLLTGAHWQCHPPRLSGYSSSSPTLWYCSQNLSQRYSRLRATRLQWAA